MSVPTVRSSLDPGCSASDIKPSLDFTYTYTNPPYDYAKFHIPSNSKIDYDSHEKDVKRPRPYWENKIIYILDLDLFRWIVINL